MRGLLGLARSHLSAVRAVVIKRTFNGFKPNVSCEENAVSQRSRSSNGTTKLLRSGGDLTVDAQFTIRPATKTESDCRSTAADYTTLRRDRLGTGVIPVHVTRLFSLFTARG